MIDAIAAACAFLLALAVFPPFIRVMRSHKYGQRIQEYTPEHQTKSGTPTMGGAVVAAVSIVALIVSCREPGVFPIIVALVLGMLLGMLDDIENVKGIGELGLTWKQKLGGQVACGVILGAWCAFQAGTVQWIPFAGRVNIGWLDPVAVAVAVVATSNAVNLTDGIDGLCGSVNVLVLAAILLIGHAAGAGPVVAAASMLGATTIAFLCYNWNPAKIFLGDTGSLSFGFALVVLCAERHLLFLLPLLGIVYVIEAASVIINVTAIVKFHHRFLLASPLHHHFQKRGRSEPAIVALLGAVALAGCALSVVIGVSAR